MKKWLSIMLTLIACIPYLTFAGATTEDTAIESGFEITFNGEMLDCTSVIYNNKHYVPLRNVFEKMGATVFYRSRDSLVLALSRDGDMIRHIVGSDSIIINGVETVVDYSSFTSDYRTYIPLEMVLVAFMPNGITFDNQQLNIQKTILTNDYHKVIKDILDLCWLGTFNPENFQKYIYQHAVMPSYSVQDVFTRVNLGLETPFYQNVKIIENPNELLVLVNKYNQLPAGFTQASLVNVSREYTVNDGKTYLLEAGAYEKYVQMSDAARKEGLNMRIVSAYRTENYQRSLYNNKVRNNGKAYADRYSARPGFSEHQTGLAVDMNSTRGTFENTPEFRWLQNHAHEYGYILRYPKGKEWITGYAYEPWHYRYVGTEAAKIIFEEGITYEEFYAKYISANKF